MPDEDYVRPIPQVVACIVIVVSVVFSLSLQVLSLPLLAADSVPESPFHPILKFTTTKELDVNHLDPAVYKQLNGISERVYWGTYHSDEIAIGEVQVVKHLCELVKGLTKSDVERLTGPPDIRVQQIQCWPDSMPGEENWLYHFGYSHVNLQIVFRDNQCIRAELFDRGRLMGLERWWSDQIQNFALGKTEKEVVAFAGEPNQKILPGDPSFRSWFREADEIIFYPIGYSTCSVVGFKGGKCIGAKAGVVLH